ncbi:MAG: hypothetical protein K6G91_07380 [Kiritimatiellae bacterium]|nr:hypothetical protein [Kiritimatiellia bacterium]
MAGVNCLEPIGAVYQGDYVEVVISKGLNDYLYQSGKGRVIEAVGGYAAWAVEKGLIGEDADWDAAPDMWEGWENAFVYLYGEGIVDGSEVLIDISFDSQGKPFITTAPVVGNRSDITATVVGSSSLGNWSNPVVLEQSGDTWTLPTGSEAHFFRLVLTY